MASVIRSMDRRIMLSPSEIVRAAVWPTAILVLISHVAWGDPGYPIEALVCGGLLAVFALIAGAYARPGVLPVIPIHLLRMYFAMGLPMFTPPRLITALGPVRISSSSLLSAALGAVAYSGCLLVATVLMLPTGRRLGRVLTFALDRRGEYSGYDTITIRCIAFLSIALHSIVSIYGAGRPQVLGPLTYVAVVLGAPELSLGLLFWDAYQTQSLSSRILRWVAVVVMSVGGLASGMLGSAVAPWLTAVLFIWTMHRRVPVLLIAAALVVVTIINPAKFVYRQLSWGKGDQITLLDRAENWITAISETYIGDAKPVYEDAASGVASRMSSLLQVVHIFEWVPARIPHAGPEAWITLPLYFVPRAFWPDKPMPTWEFNHRYAITFRLHTAQMTKGVTVNLPSIGDGYWRLGWLGVIVEGTLAGMITAFCSGLAVPGSRTGAILGTAVMGFGPESHVLGTLIALPKVFPAIVVVLLLAQWLPYLFAGARKAPVGAPSGGTPSQIS